MKKPLTVSIVLALLLLSAFFRLTDLANPGFWGDEETTSMPAYSLAQGNGSFMPSGMEYRRAALHGYAAALSARVFGPERDFSYRVPSALLGSFTVLLAFFGTRHFFGTAVAIIATALIAVSEWHILLSRTARMYGPLLFFTLAFFYAAVGWLRQRQLGFLLIALLSYAAAGTLHLLAVLILPLLVIPSVFGELNIKRLLNAAGVAGGLAAATVLFDRFYASTPYRTFVDTPPNSPLATASANPVTSFSAGLADVQATWPLFLMVVLGLLYGIWLVRCAGAVDRPDENWLRSATVQIACVPLGLATAFGHAYGAAMFFIIAMLLAAPLPMGSLRRFAIPVATGIVWLTGWAVYRISTLGFLDGIKASLKEPFPYFLYQLVNQPGVMIFFLSGTLLAVFSQEDNKPARVIRLTALTALLPMISLGLVYDWKPDRYLAPIYPLVLIVAASGLSMFTAWVARKVAPRAKSLPLLLALAIVLSGALGGHGLPQAFATAPPAYGASVATITAYPDHRSPGCLVRARLAANDIVVAEDALQQHWYAGRVDYWLRDPDRHAVYSYLDKSGSQRDIYVSSQLTTDPVIAGLSRETQKRIWVITSAEVRSKPEQYLTSGSPQQRWLQSIMQEREPVFEGRDGLSAVYCINCNFYAENSDVDPDCR